MVRIHQNSSPFFELENINFSFDINTGALLHIDETLSHLLEETGNSDTGKLINLVHQEDVDIAKQAYARLKEGKSIGIVKFRILKNAKEEWISVIPFLYRSETDLILFASICIITDEVENYQTAMKFANKKNSILQMLSHDLRGPLEIAKSMAFALGQDALEPKSLKKTKAISDILSQTIALIENLVGEEFLETVDTPLVKRRVNLVEKIAQYIEQCKQFQDLNERSFTLHVQQEEIWANIDEAKFMQIVNNLITNALKFTHANGKISIHIDETEQEIILTFNDDGIGIPEAMLPNIFDRYTVAKRPGLNGEPTTGLGLFIVREIVGWHQGTIYCESKENLGTTFTITLSK
ncbi:sensor histidine kinase KdpD [Pedobacter sp. Leaf194]|uniref:sensor histidine kinase n=1 Tax=Pedobacter sp. Leaf194 TaxID=1736297 RepID=UPI000A72E73A|nr:ATP-binding protein [Pedobacter sp. Leaf194]